MIANDSNRSTGRNDACPAPIFSTSSPFGRPLAAALLWKARGSRLKAVEKWGRRCLDAKFDYRPLPKRSAPDPTRKLLQLLQLELQLLSRRFIHAQAQLDELSQLLHSHALDHRRQVPRSICRLPDRCRSRLCIQQRRHLAG